MTTFSKPIVLVKIQLCNTILTYRSQKFVSIRDLLSSNLKSEQHGNVRNIFEAIWPQAAADINICHQKLKLEKKETFLD